MTRTNSWTPEEEAWLREVYPHHFNDEIAAMHAERFPDRPRRTDKAINSRAKVYKLHKADSFDKAARAKEACRTMWPPKRVEWLRAYAPGHNIYEIIDEFERLYGVRLTKCSMKNAKLRYGAKSGTDVGQFQKGQEPPNKGKTWDELGFSEQARENMRRGQFKKGNMPHNAVDKPVGTERVDADGYVLVKVAERPSRQDCNDNWRLKHNVVWEEANGTPVPPHTMVVFADHDNRNMDPGNLVLVPRPLWATMNRMRLPYYDRESLEAAMNVARLAQAKSTAQKRPRPCRKCGREFEPRYARQRTCDSCLGCVIESRDEQIGAS